VDAVVSPEEERMIKLRRRWIVVGIVVAMTLTGWIGWAFANRHSDPSPAAGETKINRMVETGRLQGMLNQHEQMMEQMRVNVSPQMQQLMDADPMWQLMRNGDFTQMMEDQQQQIDRMLGRGVP
jgi:hypothetical protein